MNQIKLTKKYMMISFRNWSNTLKIIYIINNKVIKSTLNRK